MIARKNQRRILKILSLILCLWGGQQGGLGLYLGQPNLLKMNKNLPSGLKIVVLTFDDGPSRVTPKILQVLAQKQVRATFFVLGERVKRFPKLLKCIHEDGHEIGNHSYFHPRFSKINLHDIDLEISTTLDIIGSIVPQKIKWFRPPYGIVNQDVRSAARTHKLTIVKWTVDPEDWKNHSSDELVEHIKAKVRNGSIILFHDTHMRTVNALPEIIDFLHEEGFTCVTLGEWLRLGGQENRHLQDSFHTELSKK